jgi:hypothetical protein
MSQPVVTEVTVVARNPLLDPERAGFDSLVVRLQGDRLPASGLADDYALVMLMRLANDPASVWQLAVAAESKTGTPSLATIPAEAASNDNWELMGTGLECDANYVGEVEVRAVFVPTSVLHDLAEECRRNPLSAADSVFALESDARQSNTRSARTVGPTGGALPSPYRQVAQLGANLSLEEFQLILGTEGFHAVVGDYVEYTFVQPDFYVYALLDSNETVVLYCVTTQNDAFKPIFRYWDGSEYRYVQLGISTFADLGNHFGSIGGFISGATASSRYYELLNLGNPSNYQTYVFAWNDAPEIEPNLGPLYLEEVNDAMEMDPTLSNPVIDQFRQINTVNTFGMTAPLFKLEEFIANNLEGDFTGGARRIEVRVRPQ